MRKLILFVIICATLNQCKVSKSESVTIQGNAKNSDQEYIILEYLPRLRGNLNFDGFKNIGTRIDNKGNFTISSKYIIHSANYFLNLGDKGIKLVLFENDNIKLDFDINDIDNTLFATGKGAGKINVFNLKQFEYEQIDTLKTVESYYFRLDSIVKSQLSLLNAIYSKDLNNVRILETINKSQIEKIITESPLSENEYDFLKKRIKIQKFTLVRSISKLCSKNLLDSTLIDFNNPVFKNFDAEEYANIDNTNNWYFENRLEEILQFEFLKSKQSTKQQIIYNNWNSSLQDDTFFPWTITFLKQNFKTDIFTKFYAEYLVSSLTLGEPFEHFYSVIKNDSISNKYLNRINNYVSLLETGLENPEYNLSSNKLTLDELSLNKLFESPGKKPTYVMFWSAQFAGASIIPNLPAIKDFEKNTKNEINFVNICVDKAKHKNLWAARIIDNTWKSNHYFLPVEGNDSTLLKYNIINISSFCYGGATYSIVAENGEIISDVESPMTITKGKINEYLNKTVR